MRIIHKRLIVLVVFVIVLALIIWLVLFTLITHVVDGMDDSFDFGDQYRYVRDYPQTLIYHEAKEYNGIGDIVVPGFILKYNYDHDHIILQNRTLESKDTLYWIVDKPTHDTISFKDSIDFISALQDKRIEMQLLDFPYYKSDK